MGLIILSISRGWDWKRRNLRVFGRKSEQDEQRSYKAAREGELWEYEGSAEREFVRRNEAETKVECDAKEKWQHCAPAVPDNYLGIDCWVTSFTECLRLRECTEQSTSAFCITSHLLWNSPVKTVISF